MACMCELCVRNRSWWERGVPLDVVDYILELELDVEYWRAVKDGSWPNGKQVLERALKNYD